MLIPIMSAVQRIEVGLVINGLRVILFGQSRHLSEEKDGTGKF